MVDREESALRDANIGFTIWSQLSIVVDFMDDSQNGPVLNGYAYDTGKMLSVTVSKAARSVKRIDPKGELVLSDFVGEAFLETSPNVWGLVEFSTQLTKLVEIVQVLSSS
jgi:hypothetical protein